MKKLFLTSVLILSTAAVQADGRRGYGGFHSGYHGGSRVSVRFGGYPYYSGWYGPRYFYSPSYVYSYPIYSGEYDYYSRPNYAVGGTLGGALIGGLIGNGINHHGWEGAGIGAAAGLLLGSAAEHNARSYERNYSSPSVSYSQPATIENAPTVNTAPTVPDAPRVQSSATYSSRSSMSSANSLFAR